MDPDFWHDKWQKKEIGFHQQEINPQLIAHWASLGIAAGAKVFVPLCGKSRDMVWLARQQHQIVGVELSESAVQDFFAENNLSPRRSEHGGLACYETDQVSIYAGDFFALADVAFREVAGVYDRAALVALPPEMRQRYVDKISASLAPGTPMLLITLEYDAEDFDSPPFCIEESEVQALYGSAFQIEKLNAVDEELKGIQVKNRAYRLFRKASAP